MEFKTSTNPVNAEEILVKIDDEQYDIAYRRLNDKEKRKIEKQVFKERKKGAKVLDLIGYGEQLLKAGESIETIKEKLDTKDKNVIRAIELEEKRQKATSEVERVEIEEELDDLTYQYKRTHFLRTLELEEIISGKDKDKFIKRVANFCQEDYQEFLSRLDLEFEKKRQGKQEE